MPHILLQYEEINVSTQEIYKSDQTYFFFFC